MKHNRSNRRIIPDNNLTRNLKIKHTLRRELLIIVLVFFACALGTFLYFLYIASELSPEDLTAFDVSVQQQIHELNSNQAEYRGTYSSADLSFKIDIPDTWTFELSKWQNVHGIFLKDGLFLYSIVDLGEMFLYEENSFTEKINTFYYRCAADGPSGGTQCTGIVSNEKFVNQHGITGYKIGVNVESYRISEEGTKTFSGVSYVVAFPQQGSENGILITKGDTILLPTTQEDEAFIMEVAESFRYE